MAVVSMKQLLEAGVHFGHQTRRWNPKMAPYIYTERNGIYIIDLQKTVKKLEEAYNFVRDCSANGGNILFVGTKKNKSVPLPVGAAVYKQYFHSGNVCVRANIGFFGITYTAACSLPEGTPRPESARHITTSASGGRGLSYGQKPAAGIARKKQGGILCRPVHCPNPGKRPG